MQFTLNVFLKDSDYFDFNTFHSLESHFGRKQIKKIRLIYIATMLILLALVLFLAGSYSFAIIYTILMSAFTVIYMLLFKKIVKRNIRKQIEKLKKNGKLPFDAVSQFEFYDNKFAEITSDKRIEQSYDSLEKICVVRDQFLYLYYNSISAYILPLAQIESQVDKNEFLSFIFQKCKTVEQY